MNKKTIITALLAITAFAANAQGQLLQYASNRPMGTARGVMPGRVILARDADMAKWDGRNGHWWDEGNIVQTKLDQLWSESLRSLTGKKTDEKAWKALFTYYNQTHGRGKQGYRQGELIAVKINLNNTFSPQDRDNDIDQSAEGVIALLRQLTREANVLEKDIIVYDASIGFAPRAIPDRLRLPVAHLFPKVRWMSARGSEGVEAAHWVENAIQYTNPQVALGTALPKAVVDATYLINMALLKGHEMTGVTLGAKNHFGSIQFPFREHDHSTVSQRNRKEGDYTALVDLMGCPALGGKTMLSVVDGVYGMQTNVSGPRLGRDQWEHLFGGGWSSCLLMSQDPVAIESVCLDMLYAEFGDQLGKSDADWSKNAARNCDNYLKEAARGTNAQFGDYRPNGVKTGSLGVFEHWNNAKEMKYSRNLGKKEGIELIIINKKGMD